MLFSSYRGLPREAKYIIYATLLPAVAYGMLYTDISYFLTNIQGLSDVTMGLIVTIMGVSMFGASIPLGMISDRYGRKKVLVAGNIVASAAIAGFALTTDPTMLALVAVLEGVSEGAASAATGALLADKCEVTRRNSVFSFFGFIQSMAYGVGSAAIYFVEVFQVLGFEQASHIILYIILAALSGISTLIMLKTTESKFLKKTKARVKDLLPRKSRGVLVKYVITGATIAFGAGLVVPLMTRWMYKRYDIPDTTSGLLLAGSSLVIGIATLAAPYLAKKFGLVKAVAMTQALSTPFMFFTPLMPEYVSASTVYTIRAFLMNMSSPLEQSMIMGLVDESERGAASGISSSLWRLPNALSTSIGAYLIEIELLSEPFFLATFFYVIAIALFWIFFKSTLMPEEAFACFNARTNLNEPKYSGKLSCSKKKPSQHRHAAGLGIFP